MAANFTGFWSRLCGSNPGLRDEESKLTMSVKSLKAQLEKAYQQGVADYGTAAKDFGDVGTSPGLSDSMRRLFPWLD